jgi:hypothetical protein
MGKKEEGFSQRHKGTQRGGLWSSDLLDSGGQGGVGRACFYEVVFSSFVEVG